MKIRKSTGYSIVLAATATAFAGCARGTADESAELLETATVTRQTIISSVDATGTIEPIRVIEVKSQAGGEILQLPVELGDYVERGTLLVRIDPRDVRNAYEQASADLEVAQARIDVAQRQLSRIQELHGSEIVTDEELEAAILEHANSKAVLVRAETNLELAEDKLDDVTLRAPIAGTIVERTVEEGQVITGTRDLTGGTALMRMADLGEMQVRTLVDETDIGKLEQGLTAEITVEAYPDRSFRGTVLKIEPQAVVEQNVTMFAVLTRIVNEDDLLRPGMNADVEIVVGRESDILTLPNMAIKTPEEARQLAEALEIDTGPLEAGAGGPRFASNRGRPGAPTEAAGREHEAGADHEQEAGEGGDATADREPEAGSETTEEGEQIGGVPISRLRSMSQDERRDWFTKLSAGERQRAFQLFQRQREQQERANRSNPGRPRPAFVFVADEVGNLSLQGITIGLSNYDFTQVVEGLEEGEVVVALPLSIIQQQELMSRIRQRSGVPGVSRGN